MVLKDVSVRLRAHSHVAAVIYTVPQENACLSNNIKKCMGFHVNHSSYTTDYNSCAITKSMELIAVYLYLIKAKSIYCIAVKVNPESRKRESSSMQSKNGISLFSGDGEPRLGIETIDKNYSW